MLRTTPRVLLPAVTIGACAVLALTLAAGTTSARPRQAIDPVAPTQGLLVMTEGDARLIGAENEGTVAVGGDLSFGQYQVAVNTAGSFVVPPDTNPTALVVGGQVDFAGSVPGTRLQVLQNGYVKIGDLTGAVVRDTDDNGAPANTRVLPVDDYDATPRIELVTRQPVASVGPASPIDFAAAFATFRSTSTTLAACAQTVILETPEGEPLPRPVPPGSNAVVTLTPGTTNVLELTATDLANIGTLTFADAPTASTPLLVDVDTTDVGDTLVWQVPTFAGVGGEQARYILFNFSTATSVTLTDESATLEGTVYAPSAEVNALTNSNIEGNVISASLVHDGGEIHNTPFSTLLDCGQPTPTPTGTTSPTGSPTATPTGTPTGTPTATPTTPQPTTPAPTKSPQPSPGPPLPVTGSSVPSMVATGLLTTAVGAALLLLARRRLRN